MTPRPALSLDAIYVVDAIARHGSFAKAAAELNKVPSALSYTVNQLECELGVKLFERSKSQTRLTPAGHDLLGEGRRLLQLAAAAELYNRDWRYHKVNNISSPLCASPIP